VSGAAPPRAPAARDPAVADPEVIPRGPWHAGPRVPGLRLREIEVVADRELPVPAGAARAVVCDLASIARTEVKAREVRVEPSEDGRRGSYWVRGSFAGVPWTGRFAYELHRCGFHSVNVERRRFGIDISGGFVVTDGSRPGTCRMRHYEQYLLPWRLVALKPLLVAFLAWSMGPELATITELARARS